MKFTKIIASLAIAGLVFVSCKKEEDKNLANIKPLETTAKEQKAIFEKLAKGEIDILIGTHKLASKDVKFKV